ncbi:MAG: XRE family transcriptional regulator [Deltaproteobacteria bacterium]|nr:XRE family transcriptional regulator [Deltaproteobacteria bacterium]
MAKKSGNAAAELTPTEQWRAKKIQEIYRNGSYLQRDLAQALGIHQSQISRYLRGQSAWKHKHLEKLAEIYQVHLRDLLIDKGSVPVLGWISDEGIPYPLIQTPLEGIKPLETAPLPPELNHIKDLYCLKVKDESFGNPVIRRGTTIYCQRRREARHGDLVIFTDETGTARLRQFMLLEESVLFKSINPGGSDIERPLSDLSSAVDVVVWIRLPV